MKPLSKGDPCFVRLHTGEVVEAIYCEPHWIYAVRVKKQHIVFITINGNNFPRFAGKYSPNIIGRVRFVGPSCDIEPVGVKA